VLGAYRGMREGLQKRILEMFEWRPMGGL